MKRYLISTIAVLVVLSVTMSVYAQGQAAGGEARGGGRGTGTRGGRGTQQLQDAIAAIEAQVANLKKVLATEMPRPEGGFQDMSEEERAKFREQRNKQREQQQAAATVIGQQVKILKGNQLQVEHQAQIDELQAIADSATKEKATATAKMVQDIIAKRTKAFEDIVEKLGIRLRRGRGQGQGGQRRGQQQ